MTRKDTTANLTAEKLNEKIKKNAEYGKISNPNSPFTFPPGEQVYKSGTVYMWANRQGQIEVSTVPRAEHVYGMSSHLELWVNGPRRPDESQLQDLKDFFRALNPNITVVIEP